MRVPLFVIGNVELNDHKCNDDVFLIFFFRRDKVYMRLKHANALYSDSLEHLPLSSNEAIWMPYISLCNIYIYVFLFIYIYKLSIHEAFEDIIIKALEMTPIPCPCA